ncbi:TrbC/VirB2 family protein [Phenylobacterium sp.]|uniref:TrbC/VirB2 family protein n=1 Tax=Phenylobacterium sp. TaxID=1871053 RepID=UPI00272F0EE4|nr:TrbC/VirB2 family protein [Phenylobacterium sp.]MDP1598516.1 TrbC/VirB2 family protein [Phenylobacterium sp.]MDP3592697.1 TrbC/VirB2 family protein [Phenylobacterium sp.]
MAMGHHQRPVGRSASVARIGILVVAFAAVASGAHAAGGGTAMPWDGPLQTIADSITGPVAKAVGVIAIAVTGLGVAFAEGGSWVRRGLGIVFGLAIAFTASSFAASFFGFTGGAGF